MERPKHGKLPTQKTTRCAKRKSRPIGSAPKNNIGLTHIIRNRLGHAIVAIGALPEGFGPEVLTIVCWRRGARYISRRPSMAFSMVTSSVYSMSLPTGIPMAMRVTRSPFPCPCPCACRFSCSAR